MKTYGELRHEIWAEFWATTRSGWKGGQSKAVARRRASDKALLHRRERRLAKLGLAKQQNSQ